MSGRRAPDAARPIAALAFGLSLLAAPAAWADAHFGRNVFIGGHDVSQQTFTPQRRGVYYLYDRQPHRPGCGWRRHGDGSRTKICRHKILR